MSDIFGESPKGLFRLVGDGDFNSVRVFVCVHVRVILCVRLNLISPKNLAEMLIVFLLLDRKSILAED